MTCRHGTNLRDCAIVCPMCGHGCPSHRAQANGRGVGGDTCWECSGAQFCATWMEPTGDPAIDAGLELRRRFGTSLQWVDVYSWGYCVGRIVLSPGRTDDELIIGIRLRARVQRRGIGTSIYRQLGVLVAPSVITSGRKQTPAAVALWASLERSGSAVRRDGYWRLEPRRDQ